MLGRFAAAPGARGSDLEARTSAPTPDGDTWARAVAALLSFQAPPPAPVECRPTDGSLTAGSDAPEPAARQLTAGSGTLDGGNEDDGANHLILRVDGGKWGPIELSLHRSEQGLRLAVGVENMSSLNGLAPEQGALRAALEAAGIRVASLHVVPAGAGGMALAKQRLERRTASSQGDTPEGGSSEGTRRRARDKRINLVG